MDLHLVVADGQLKICTVQAQEKQEEGQHEDGQADNRAVIKDLSRPRSQVDGLADADTLIHQHAAVIGVVVKSALPVVILIDADGRLAPGQEPVLAAADLAMGQENGCQAESTIERPIMLSISLLCDGNEHYYHVRHGCS